MDEIKKQKISLELSKYVQRQGSQNKAANSLKGVSPATVSQILHQNWDLISDEMWRNIAAQIGYKDTDWNVVETMDYRILTALLNDAQEYHNVFAVTGDAGTGKSFAIKQYCLNNRRAYMLSCSEYWNRRIFLQELLMAMGRDPIGYSMEAMIYHAIHTLKKEDSPLIIIDEADKLSDAVLYFFITLYNHLEDHAGIVLVATSYLEKRLKCGLQYNKKGYNEIYSRIGRKCIELKGVSANDIAMVCEANGLNQKDQISKVISDCEGDLRRVRRGIHALKIKSKAD